MANLSFRFCGVKQERKNKRAEKIRIEATDGENRESRSPSRNNLSRSEELPPYARGGETLRSWRLKSRLEIDWRKVVGDEVEEGKGGAGKHEAGMGYRGESSRHVVQVANLVTGARFLAPRERTPVNPTAAYFYSLVSFDRASRHTQMPPVARNSCDRSTDSDASSSLRKCSFD